MDKKILIQYADLVEEVKETRHKIERLEDEIPKIQARINVIESGEIVKDKVYGGEGGWQGFKIEGIPTAEYQKKKNELLTKKLLLNNRKSSLEILEFELLQKTNEVEEFISSVEDSHMRRIINLRFIENLSWLQVANRIGGNTESSVKMAFQRYMEKN